MYKILDTTNNKLFQPTLIGLTLEGTQLGEYVTVIYKNNTYKFLATEVEEIVSNDKPKQILPIIIDTTVCEENIVTPTENKITTKQPKKEAFKTNKTKVINSINIWNKTERKQSDIKELLEIKSKLRKKTKDDIEGITYFYNRIITLYHLSGKQLINSNIMYILKDTVKYIIESNIKIDTWEYEEVKGWDKLGIL